MKKVIIYFFKFLLAIIFCGILIIFLPYFIFIIPILLPVYAFIDGLINKKFSNKKSTKIFLFSIIIVYIFCLGFWVYALGCFLGFIDDKNFITI